MITIFTVKWKWSMCFYVNVSTVLLLSLAVKGRMRKTTFELTLWEFGIEFQQRLQLQLCWTMEQFELIRYLYFSELYAIETFSLQAIQVQMEWNGFSDRKKSLWTNTYTKNKWKSLCVCVFPSGHSKWFGKWRCLPTFNWCRWISFAVVNVTVIMYCHDFSSPRFRSTIDRFASSRS